MGVTPSIPLIISDEPELAPALFSMKLKTIEEKWKQWRMEKTTGAPQETRFETDSALHVAGTLLPSEIAEMVVNMFQVPAVPIILDKENTSLLSSEFEEISGAESDFSDSTSGRSEMEIDLRKSMHNRDTDRDTSFTGTDDLLETLSNTLQTNTDRPSTSSQVEMMVEILMDHDEKANFLRAGSEQNGPINLKDVLSRSTSKNTSLASQLPQTIQRQSDVSVKDEENSDVSSLLKQPSRTSSLDKPPTIDVFEFFSSLSIFADVADEDSMVRQDGTSNIKQPLCHDLWEAGFMLKSHMADKKGGGGKSKSDRTANESEYSNTNNSLDSSHGLDGDESNEPPPRSSVLPRDEVADPVYGASNFRSTLMGDKKKSISSKLTNQLLLPNDVPSITVSQRTSLARSDRSDESNPSDRVSLKRNITGPFLDEGKDTNNSGRMTHAESRETEMQERVSITSDEENADDTEVEIAQKNIQDYDNLRSQAKMMEKCCLFDQEASWELSNLFDIMEAEISDLKGAHLFNESAECEKLVSKWKVKDNRVSLDSVGLLEKMKFWFEIKGGSVLHSSNVLLLLAQVAKGIRHLAGIASPTIEEIRSVLEADRFYTPEEVVQILWKRADDYLHNFCCLMPYPKLSQNMDSALFELRQELGIPLSGGESSRQGLISEITYDKAALIWTKYVSYDPSIITVIRNIAEERCTDGYGIAFHKAEPKDAALNIDDDGPHPYYLHRNLPSSEDIVLMMIPALVCNMMDPQKCDRFTERHFSVIRDLCEENSDFFDLPGLSDLFPELEDEDEMIQYFPAERIIVEASLGAIVEERKQYERYLFMEFNKLDMDGTSTISMVDMRQYVETLLCFHLEKIPSSEEQVLVTFASEFLLEELLPCIDLSDDEIGFMTFPTFCKAIRVIQSKFHEIENVRKADVLDLVKHLLDITLKPEHATRISQKCGEGEIDQLNDTSCVASESGHELEEDQKVPGEEGGDGADGTTRPTEMKSIDSEAPPPKKKNSKRITGWLSSDSDYSDVGGQ